MGSWRIKIMALTVDEARQLVALTDKIIDLENLNAELLELVRQAGPDGAVDLLFHNHDQEAHPELVAAVSAELAELVAGHEEQAEAHPLLTAKLLEELTSHDSDQEAHPDLSARLAQSLTDHEEDRSAHSSLGASLAQSLTDHEDNADAHASLITRLDQKITDHEDDQAAHPALSQTLSQALSGALTDHQTDAGAHPEVRAALARSLADHAEDGAAHSALKTSLTQSLTAHDTSAAAHAALASKLSGNLTDHNGDSGAHAAILTQATANLNTHNNYASAHVALRASMAEAADITVAHKFLSPATLEWARPRLRADRTFYVRSTGNDANQGLTATSAFKTIEAALKQLPGLRSQGFAVTIDIGPGSWTSLVLDPSKLGDVRRLTLKGSGSDTIIGGTGTAIQINYLKGDLRLQNLSLMQADSGGLKVTSSERVQCEDVTFYIYASADLIVSENSTLEITGYTDICNPNGKAGRTLFRTARGGQLIVSGTLTVADAVSVTPAAVQASGNSYMEFGCVINGGAKATGPRYSAGQNSYIYVAGAGANYLPGNAAGSVITGGGYA